MSKNNENTNITFYTKICEIVKIEATVISFLFVAFSVLLNAISFFNKLAFDLATGYQKKLPDEYIPYGPVMTKFIYFGMTGITALIFGVLAIYCNNKIQKICGLISILLFFVSMIIFGYTIYSHRLTFLYHVSNYCK